jgi:hypothetical protein
MPEISYQVKHRDDDAYYRVVLPNFETGEPEVVIRYHDDGRIFLDSGAVDIHYIRRRKHTRPSETVSVELRRERFANPRDGLSENSNPESDRTSSAIIIWDEPIDPDYI